MRKIIRYLLLMQILIIVVSCGSSDTPRAVADKFLKALSTEDFEVAKKYGTKDTEKLLEMYNGIKKMTVDSVRAEHKYEITGEKVEGDNATIFYKEDHKPGMNQLSMIKVDGKWKVMLTKEAINTAEGDNSLEIGATSTDTISN
jgi:hypothetical protein